MLCLISHTNIQLGQPRCLYSSREFVLGSIFACEIRLDRAPLAAIFKMYVFGYAVPSQ